MENLENLKHKKLKLTLDELRSIEPAEVYRAYDEKKDGLLMDTSLSSPAIRYKNRCGYLFENFGIKSKIDYKTALWNNPLWYGSESCDFRNDYPAFWEYYVQSEVSDEDELLENIAGIGNDGETEHFVCEGTFSEFSIEKIIEHRQDLINQIVEKMFPQDELEKLRRGNLGAWHEWDEEQLLFESFLLDDESESNIGKAFSEQKKVLNTQGVKPLENSGNNLSKMPFFTGSSPGPGQNAKIWEQFLDAAIFSARKFLAENPEKKHVEIRSRNCHGVYRQRVTREEI
jgi:hypothetical protein